MKKIALALVLALSTATAALAAAPGGFTGPGATGAPGPVPGDISTVAQALTMPDDTWVTLEGYVVEKLSQYKERYTFKDSSGSMVVEIEPKVFMGHNIDPQTKVRILGEVDTSRNRPSEVEVKQLGVVK